MQESLEGVSGTVSISSHSSLRFGRGFILARTSDAFGVSIRSITSAFASEPSKSLVPTDQRLREPAQRDVAEPSREDDVHNERLPWSSSGVPTEIAGVEQLSEFFKANCVSLVRVGDSS